MPARNDSLTRMRSDSGGEGTKTIPERCSDKTCPNHNPHKLKKEPQ
jgi:hypothetical protein